MHPGRTNTPGRHNSTFEQRLREGRCTPGELRQYVGASYPMQYVETFEETIYWLRWLLGVYPDFGWLAGDGETPRYWLGAPNTTPRLSTGGAPSVDVSPWVDRHRNVIPSERYNGTSHRNATTPIDPAPGEDTIIRILARQSPEWIANRVIFSTAVPGGQGYLVYKTGTTGAVAVSAKTSGGVGAVATPAGSLQSGTWITVVIVHDRTTNQLRIMTPIGSYAAAVPVGSVSGAGVCIGAYVNGVSQITDGTLIASICVYYGPGLASAMTDARMEELSHRLTALFPRQGIAGNFANATCKSWTCSAGIWHLGSPGLPRSGDGIGQLVEPMKINRCRANINPVDISPWSAYGGTEQIADGDMEAVGVGAWTAVNGAVLTKVGGAHGGAQCLRSAWGGVANPGTTQPIVSGRTYRARGYCRSDGIARPAALYHGGAWLFWGVIGAGWQYFDVTFTATSNTIQFYTITGVASFVEWDDISVVEVAVTRPDDSAQLGTTFGCWGPNVYKIVPVGDQIYFTTGYVANTNPHSQSYFLRGGAGGESVDVGVYDTATLTFTLLEMFILTTAWQRYNVDDFTPGSATEVLAFDLDSADEVYIIGEQLEEGEISTTPIPNWATGAAAQRNWDDFVETDVPISEEGTVEFKITPVGWSGAGLVNISIMFQTWGGLATFYVNGGTWRMELDGTTPVDSGVAPVDGVEHLVKIGWTRGGNMSLSVYDAATYALLGRAEAAFDGTLRYAGSWEFISGAGPYRIRDFLTYRNGDG